MRTRLLTLMAAVALASPALAVDSYNIDASHASVAFQVRHLMSQVTGKFTGFEGSVKIDRADPAASSVDFTIKADTVDTANDRRDGHLKGETSSTPSRSSAK